MTVIEIPDAPVTADRQTVGPIGRLGRWRPTHLRARRARLGRSSPSCSAVFAPSVETALSGAGWQANGSESVAARELIERELRRALQLGA